MKQHENSRERSNKRKPNLANETKQTKTKQDKKQASEQANKTHTNKRNKCPNEQDETNVQMKQMSKTKQHQYQHHHQALPHSVDILDRAAHFGSRSSSSNA